MKWIIVTAFPDTGLDQRWREFLGNADNPAAYTSPDYFRDVLIEGRDAFAVLALDGPEVVGVVSGVRAGKTIRCGHGGRPQVSLLAGADPDKRDKIASMLAQGLRQHAGRSASLVYVHSWTAIDALARHGFRKRVLAGEEKGIVVLDLSLGRDALFKGMSESRRNKVRRAIRNRVEVSPLDCDKEFDAFYEIYRDWCDFKGFPLEPAEQMKRAFSQTDFRLVLAARHQGALIAVSLLRFSRLGMGSIEYSANWSRREETKARPNDLLMWRAIEWAINNGLRTFSMGASHFFLRSFGGELVPTYRYTLDRTPLQQHHLRESGHDLALRVYKGMPEPLRQMARGARRRVENVMRRLRQRNRAR